MLGLWDWVISTNQTIDGCRNAWEMADVKIESDASTSERSEENENSGWTTVAKRRSKIAKVSVEMQFSKQAHAPTSQFVVGVGFRDKEMYVGNSFYVYKMVKNALCAVESVRVTRGGIVLLCCASESKISEH